MPNHSRLRRCQVSLDLFSLAVLLLLVIWPDIVLVTRLQTGSFNYFFGSFSLQPTRDTLRFPSNSPWRRHRCWPSEHTFKKARQRGLRIWSMNRWCSVSRAPGRTNIGEDVTGILPLFFFTRFLSSPSDLLLWFLFRLDCRRFLSNSFWDVYNVRACYMYNLYTGETLIYM